MTETNPSSPSEAPLIDPVDHLPLRLLRSDSIPPAPNRSVSTIDWLPDFAGHSWLAYGASSLLVISHFPSPLSPQETLIGPVIRQVFELSGRPSSPVAAVCWSPLTPSIGEVAAAADKFVVLFSNDSASSEGSFCWSQNAVLVQSTNVEAIAWTGSADGIIVGGIDVTLWRRKNKSWEIAWKFKRDLPQNLVSSTWSIDGLSAVAAACPSKLCFDGHNSRSTSVTVCYSTGTSEYAKTELHHPQHVSMIQWRPLAEQLDSDANYLRRHILLTCCQDGTVRLWTEVDNRNVRKFTKDNYDQHSQWRNFGVAAVIEINQTLCGSLGADVFLIWATEINGIFRTRQGANEFYFDGDGNDKVGACEWLVGYGPGTLVTFWAVHCLDDISPLRFPRVTLWKRHELQDLEARHVSTNDFANSKDWLLIRKVVFLRHHLYVPPNICSLIHFSPCDSFFWSVLYDQPQNATENGSSDNLKVQNHSSFGSFSTIGHTGKILQLAIHPRIYEVGLAASLDSNGLLIFWSVPTAPSNDFGLSTLNSTWKFCGKLHTHALRAKYTSLRWAPCFFHAECLLLLGHADGIDCFLVKLSQTGDQKIKCHCICSVPFTGRVARTDDPVEVFSIPLPSTCDKSFKYKKFLLLGIWMKDFQALSWEVTLHSHDGPEDRCECKFDDRNSEMCFGWKFQSTFSETQYHLGVNPCSSLLPEQHSHNQITSYSIVCPDYLIPEFESPGSNDNSCPEPPYVMATGCLDGSVKLWKSISCEQSTLDIPWKLVGDFIAHQSPIITISLAANGSKIATSCVGNQIDNASIIHVWDIIRLPGTGMFLLEDKITIVEDVIALNWLALGNGQYLLGACVQNELLIYAQKQSVSQALLDHRKSLDQHNWSCVAVTHTFAAICGFVWGPQVSAVVVHENYFDVFSQWSVLMDGKPQADSCPSLIREKYQVQNDKGSLCSIFFDDDRSNVGELSSENVSWKDLPVIKFQIYDLLSSNMNLTQGLLECGSSSISGSWSLVDIAEKLRGTLPIHHPEVLLTNIYSGNWKRAYASVQHLVEHIGSISETKCGTANLGHFVPQIPLSVYIEGHLAKGSTDTGFQWTSDSTLPASSSQAFIFNSNYDSPNNMISPSSSKSEFTSLIGILEKSYDLAALTNVEKLQTITIVDLLGDIQQSNSAYQNLDGPGRRFWVALRYQQLHFFRSFDRLPSLEDLVTDGRMISWAFHSDCQETLLTSFLPSEPTWNEMKALGFGFWFSNDRQLRTRMEKLARSQYLRKKDPKDCAILYIALNRLQVLGGLFKISKDEKDKPLVAFLSRDFKEKKNKAAALKNAYVLMGKHQLELAIAFFLLGGDTNSAITVCAKNLGDEQLALIICRLVEGSGGPLECYLITKFILPSAIESCNSWISSLLEWKLGNYLQSFLRMVDITMGFSVDNPSFWSNHVAFKDPGIGIYCSFLATRNSMRNAIGEQNAVILGRWASFLEATAFSRCGLPLEALECLSSSLNFWAMDQGSLSNSGHSQNQEELPARFASDPCNWLSSDVALYMECTSKLDLSLQYLSKLTREHPSWRHTVVDSVGPPQHDKSVKVFQQKFYDGLAKLEQKFSVISSSVAQMVVVWLCNNGLCIAGCDLLLNYASQGHLQNKTCAIDGSNLHSILYNLLSKAMDRTSLMLSRYIVCCNISCFPQRLISCPRNGGAVKVTPEVPSFLGLYLQGIVETLYSLRSDMGLLSGCLSVDFTKSLVILDLFEYFVHFASAWFQHSSKGLLLMAQPLLITCTDGHTPYALDTKNLKSILHHISELLASNLTTNVSALEHEDATHVPYAQIGKKGQALSEDEKWILIGGCLWLHMSRLLKHKLQVLSISLDDDCSAFTGGQISFLLSGVPLCGSGGSNNMEQTRDFSPELGKLLNAALIHISSSHVKLLIAYLLQVAKKRPQVPLIMWLEDSYESQAKIHYQDVSADVLSSKNETSTLEILWDCCADPRMIYEGFAQENFNFTQFSHLKTSKSWIDLHKGISEVHDMLGVLDHDANLTSIAVNDEVAFSAKGLFMNFRTLLSSWQKDAAISKKVSIFQNAQEVHRREGELLEALCTNAINEAEAALASNRKGILFFNWAEQKRSRDHADYIWSDVDWPPNGWAGAESTPVPTFVSPGVGLGRKKGAHVGLGGATVGHTSLARSRGLTGGAAVVGVPGNRGLAASGLGWEVQEDFEQLADPPATVKNISTRAFSSHPSRPLFLVGSSNTHVYLWEFGKEKAAATYGVLPAANVPPPYGLASISSLQFDYCGHRFASAALDGTVCTWQLEVGGRSNICPTESSLCFNSHALDVAYVGSSGSVVAAAGYSSNGVNVVIWDTLAPPTTSRASIICHEGGARSISVFNNDFGSGSISPLIVTGGKSGDIGVHDFRYIATGRSKRHRQFNNSNSAAALSSGEQNQKGMLWYIPKAHMDSITKISIVPHTSLFLTGSKDGDVKLWDAKAAKLVHHWPKLHERHTFVQPSSRGFSGVVRAGVTDIQVLPHGFLSCGGDGSVKLVELTDPILLTPAPEGDSMKDIT